MEQTVGAANVLQAQPTRIFWLEPMLGAEALEQAREWIERGIQVADIGGTFDGIRERVAGGEYRVAMIRCGSELAGVLVLEMLDTGTPPRKTLSVVVAGGERMSEWLYPMNRALREIARAHKCERVVIAGRPGWERALRRLGWEKVGVILEAKPR